MYYRKGVLTATIGDCETQTKLWSLVWVSPCTSLVFCICELFLSMYFLFTMVLSFSGDLWLFISSCYLLTFHKLVYKYVICGYYNRFFWHVVCFEDLTTIILIQINIIFRITINIGLAAEQYILSCWSHWSHLLILLSRYGRTYVIFYSVCIPITLYIYCWFVWIVTILFRSFDFPICRRWAVPGENYSGNALCALNCTRIIIT